jgi:hypothetical protein
MNMEQLKREFAGDNAVLGEHLPIVALYATNPTYLEIGSSTGHRGGKPATNRLSYGMAQA